MFCKEVVVGKNYLCNKTCFKDDKRCYIHIRKWLQNHLKEFDIVIDFPRTCKEVYDALNLLKSIDPTYRDCHGFNMLHYGAMDNDTNLFKQGLEIGININSRTEFSNYTSLHLIRGNKDLILLCLKSEAIIDALDPYKNTPLMLHCRHYPMYKQTIRLFLEWGADPTIKNTCKVSPCEISSSNLIFYKNVNHKQTFNLLSIVNVWNTAECINWRHSILSRFIKRLPNISNRGSLFDALYDHLELSHILCIQYV